MDFGGIGPMLFYCFVYFIIAFTLAKSREHELFCFFIP